MVLKHWRRDLILDGLADWEGKLGFVAFYKGATPTFFPILSGVRICLEFALLPRKKVQPPTHRINFATETRLQTIANEWTAMKEGVTRLGYPLDHNYTPESFGFDALKGRDLNVRRPCSVSSPPPLDGASYHLDHL
jgi:hypothetical protein